MSEPTQEQADPLTILGRVVFGLWAINFLLLVTDTVTYSGQSTVSLVLAVASVALMLLRRKGS